MLDQLPHALEPGGDPVEHGTVGVRELAGKRDGPEIAIRVGQRPVDEVSPVREQLVVVATDELGPREVGVLQLGAAGREEVAHWIRVVPLEHVAHVDRHRPTGRELLALHGQELTCDDVVREMQRLAGAELATLVVAEQHRRPDDRVEDDVVLAHEVGMV